MIEICTLYVLLLERFIFLYIKFTDINNFQARGING